VAAGGRGEDGRSTTGGCGGDGGRTGAEDQEWRRRGWQQFDADAARSEPAGAVVLEDGAQRKGRRSRPSELAEAAGGERTGLQHRERGGEYASRGCRRGGALRCSCRRREEPCVRIAAARSAGKRLLMLLEELVREKIRKQ
jgi:hypothetical protein